MKYLKFTVLLLVTAASFAWADDATPPVLADFRFSDHFKLVVGATFPRYIVFTNGQLTPGKIGANYSIIEALSVGDFNNDKCDDLVVSFADTFMRPLFFTSNCDGTFKQSMNVPEEAARRHIRNTAVVDLNGDGFLDYVGFTAPHNRYRDVLGSEWGPKEPDLVLINRGGTGFQEVKGFESTYHHGGAVGDLNNDGLIDIFGLSEFPKGNEFYDLRAPTLQRANLTFVKEKAGLGKYFDDLMTSSMRIADLNGDGNLDYVITIAPRVSNMGGPLGTPMASTDVGSIAYAFGDGTGSVSKLKWTKLGTHWMTKEQWGEFLKNNDKNPSGKKDYTSGPSNVELVDLDDDGTP